MNKRRRMIEHLVDRLGLDELHEAKETEHIFAFMPSARKVRRTKGTTATDMETARLTDPGYRELLKRERDKQAAKRDAAKYPVRNKYNPYEMTRRELAVDIARQALGFGPKKPPPNLSLIHI